MSLQQQIGRNIAFLRKQKGISQEHLALEAGIQRTYLGAIERGEKNISVIYLHKILTALGMKLDRFFRELDV